MTEESNSTNHSNNSNSNLNSVIIAGGLIISTIIAAATYNKVEERREPLNPKLVTQINYDGGMSRIGYLKRIEEVVDVSVDVNLDTSADDYSGSPEEVVNILNESSKSIAKRLKTDQEKVVYTKPVKVELIAVTKYYGTSSNHRMLDYKINKTFPENTRPLDIVKWIENESIIAERKMSISPVLNTELVYGDINF